MSERKTRTYDKDYKVEAVKLAREIGIKPACDQLDIPYGTLNGWVKKAENAEIRLGKGDYKPEEVASFAQQLEEERKRNKQLEKELKRLKEEKEILMDVAAFFAESHRRSARKSD